MNIEEYIKFTRTTMIYPQQEALMYLILGLSAESGEIANKYKKVLRGDYGIDDVLEELEKEIGDLCWYLFRLLDEIKQYKEDNNLISPAKTEEYFQEILHKNAEKLLSRKDRAKLQGKGDNR